MNIYKKTVTVLFTVLLYMSNDGNIDTIICLVLL
jgi:hypothetical protein